MSPKNNNPPFPPHLNNVFINQRLSDQALHIYNVILPVNANTADSPHTNRPPDFFKILYLQYCKHFTHTRISKSYHLRAMPEVFGPPFAFLLPRQTTCGSTERNGFCRRPSIRPSASLIWSEFTSSKRCNSGFGSKQRHPGKGETEVRRLSFLSHRQTHTEEDHNHEEFHQ